MFSAINLNFLADFVASGGLYTLPSVSLKYYCDSLILFSRCYQRQCPEMPRGS